MDGGPSHSNGENEDILELPDLPPPPVDVPIEDEGALPEAFESLSVEQDSESEVPGPGNYAGIESLNTEALSPADGEAIGDGETESAEADPTGTVNEDSFEQSAETPAPEKVKRSRSFSPLGLFADRIESWWAVLFIGVVLGLLPLWNGAVFTTAFIVLAVIFVIFPIRRQLIVIAVVAGVLGAPQLWYLTSGTRPAGYSIIRFGYTIDDATVYAVIYYLLFTFGFKWLLMAVGLYFSRWIHRGLFLAFSALIGVAFSFRFSEEVLVNHKFLNIWLILANVFVAYGAVRLWNISIARTRIPMRLVTVVLLFLVTVGGFIDLFPIKNSFYIGVNYGGDRLVEWVTANTDPRAVFLSQRYINHQILMAGRRLFYGEPYYAWGAGYDTGKRDQIYRRMFESNDPREVFDLLKQNHIDFVAIDDAIRSGGPNARKSNESLYAAYFPLVFEDTENRYANIKIYKVTDELGSPNPTIPVSKPEPTPAPSPAETFSAFTGGVGTEPGQFAGPRGLATDDHGNIYVSDTGNSRIQEFDPEGKFITFIGTAGSGPGELRQPNGIAVDPSGNIYVADAMNQKLIKYGADGKFVSEWKGPDSGFYGPRDLAFGANKLLYIIDQGRTRVARFDPASEQFIVWGTSGDGDGQINEATGITVGDNLVFVADAMNNRIQVFDLNGNFVRQWPVPVWEKYGAHYPDVVFDEVAGRLYVTSGRTNEVLSFSSNGDQLENIKPTPGTALENPSTLCISQTKDRRRLLILNTGGARVTAVELEARKTK
jgi:DNA-binding beta-propeller fold protein YncE